jgi:hypothetical protein
MGVCDAVGSAGPCADLQMTRCPGKLCGALCGRVQDSGGCLPSLSGRCWGRLARLVFSSCRRARYRPVLATVFGSVWPRRVPARPPGARVMAAGAHRLSGGRLPPVQGPVATVPAETVDLRRNGRHGAGCAGPRLVPAPSISGLDPCDGSNRISHVQVPIIDWYESLP